MKDSQRKAMWANKLLKISVSGKISEPLKDVVNATQKALKKNDYKLASELTSVKAVMTGSMKSPSDEYPYREDEVFNRKTLGNSVYLELDAMHHDLAIKSHSVPSGTAVIRKGSIIKREITPSTNPLIKKINEEHIRQVEGVKNYVPNGVPFGFRGMKK